MAAAEYAADNHGSSAGGGGDYYPHGAVVKGKRTKRMRLLQVLAPRAPPAASSASSSAEQSAGSTTTEEEVDTANSLIMLAERPVVGTVLDYSEPRVEEGPGGGEGAEAETAAGVKVGGIAYQCRTCNKCFQSFQALGGHRASHNKPKAMQPPPATAEIEKRATMVDEDGVKVMCLASSHKMIINTGILPDDGGGRTTTPAAITITSSTRGYNHNNSDDGGNIHNHNTAAASANKPKVHECAICGSEFSSGQALGGHMRRHRAPAPAPRPKIKERSILSLDLNLPAPMDDERASSLSFGFLPSALVDCHH